MNVDKILSERDFQLGIFSANCSGGFAATKIPERWSASWDDNVRLAKLADEVGIDFLLPITRWIGYGGETNFHGSVLEPIAWASGLLALTKRIRIFSTVNTSYTHPVVVAKQMATADQIGHGRAGLNIVAGWNQPEYEVFGIDLPADHNERYALAQEWWDVIQKIWSSEERFDYNGKYFNLEHVEGDPKPYRGTIPILNAGSSGQGRDFATRNSNFVLTSVMGPEDGANIVKTLKANAKEKFNRNVGIFTTSHVVCRPTKEEAADFLNYYAVENADWGAVDNLMNLQKLHAKSFTEEMLQTFRSRFASGHGSIPLVGTPDDVANEIRRFYDAGFAGMTLAFVDYVGELEYFAQEVLPRLERMGIRAPRLETQEV
ncbi:luciferase-like monooxygenase [Neobacillus bataviensis LMG 21833]|uniref:Luciferase-like monooxygenase n=1 Tax=Neobacillus bataviensis LMG 21833 TaxID=1117379 RepID=K6DJE8_9BACI|nr:LLM class flavin-dependent oxidoreductase [Neobacillus bataviensis]EKN68439.1 luciferase-like monooxygenase [Neobacillus bataviensis LMG 21833]